ncbi:MAG: caspase family protein [Mycobacteriales bacterium]|nr:caspase family protein [Frankia sp.]
MPRIRACLALLALGLVALPGLAGANAARMREVDASYFGAGGSSSVESWHVSTSSSGGGYGGAWFDAMQSETAVTVRMEDNTGRSVAAHIDYEGRDHTRHDLVICGVTAGVIQIIGGSSIGVYPVVGSCPDGTLSTPTSGRITATFITPGTAAPSPARATSGVVAPSDRWALVIGITAYRSPTHPTIGGANDARVIRRALLRAGWPDDHIRYLVDDAATGSAIRDGLRWLDDVTTPQSFTFFHYSGHVKQSDGHEYLWPVDRAFVSDTDTVNALRQVSGRAWFDFAGCESGGFDDGLASYDHFVTASSQYTEKSYENPDWNESVWTGLVFEMGMWRGDADSNSNHQVTVGEALNYGNDVAPKMTANERPYGPQHPYTAGGWGTDWRLELPPIG